MKHFILFLFITVGLISFAAVGEGILHFSFSEEIHDFGLIEANKPVTNVFYLENQGDSPILIKDIKSPCGCTVASFTKEPISPQEKGEIEVRYNAAKKGIFQKDLKVYIDGQEKPSILSIKGEVK